MLTTYLLITQNTQKPTKTRFTIAAPVFFTKPLFES